jgi:predicted DNA-binding transcriptional regulator AlpA
MNDQYKPKRMLTTPEVLKMVPLSRATLRRLGASGDFPQPLKMGRRKVYYLEQDVINWLEGLHKRGS